MPINKQAKKRIRSDAKRAMRNKSVRSRVKTLRKKFLQITDTKDIDQKTKILSKEFDKAASKGIIPKKRADRIKSRAAKKAAKVSS